MKILRKTSSHFVCESCDDIFEYPPSITVVGEYKVCGTCAIDRTIDFCPNCHEVKKVKNIHTDFCQDCEDEENN